MTPARLTAVLATALLACQSTQTDPPLPWLRGFHDATASDQASAAGRRRLDRIAEQVTEDCAPGAYEAVELVGDIAPQQGLERIVASYASGIYVFDAEDQLLVASPGYRCEGTADTIEILAAGTSWGQRTLVVVGTSGGRNESATWLGLLRVGLHGRLEAMFTGDVEERLGEATVRGGLLLLPGALIYRPPGGQPQLWVLDPVPDVYVPPLDLLDRSDHEGPRPPMTVL